MGTLNSILTSLHLITLSGRNDSRFSIIKSWAINTPNQSELNYVNPYTLINMRDTFNMALLPYSLPADAGLLFPNGMAVTRSVISNNPDLFPFYGYFLQCGDLTLEAWQNLLISGSTFLPAMPYTSANYGSYDAVTYTEPWAYIGYPEKAVFFAALPVESIVTLLTDADVERMAYISMYDAAGKLLFSRGNQINGHFYVENYQSPIYPIRYEIDIPDSFFNAQLQPVRNQIFLYTCITAAVVVMLSFLFAWRSSQPERSFLEQVNLIGIDRTGFKIFSSLKRIYKDLADSISSEKNQLETSLRTIETQTALIRIQTIDKIRKALLLGDEVMSLTILRECAASLPRPEDPLIAALLVRMLSAMVRDVSKDCSGIVPYLNTIEYVSGNQEEIFNRYFPEYFMQICRSINANKEKNISTLGQKVLTYINDNLYNPNLYITMVSDYFKISAPTLQKLVKHYTGLTFQNYIEKNRLNRACELLQSSGGTVTQIALTCGFSSSTSFNRSFKRNYGFPPSQFQDKG